MPDVNLSRFITNPIKMKFSIAFLMLILAVTTSCNKAELTEESLITTALISNEANNKTEIEIFSLVNNYRIELGLSQLAFNNQAKDYTVDHNAYMISKNEINHDNFAQRASELSVDVNATRVSENVGRNFRSALGVFESWLASASHLKNIEGDYSETAISVLASDDGMLYFTQVFIK